MVTVEKLAKQAIELKPVERLRLVEAILFSLDKTDPDIEKSWVAESELRYKAYKQGELKAHNWNDIKKRYEN
jgi:putative addiction module component (TIGR02574 family)